MGLGGCGRSPYRTCLSLFSLLIPEIAGNFLETQGNGLRFSAKERQFRAGGSWFRPKINRQLSGGYQAGTGGKLGREGSLRRPRLPSNPTIWFGEIPARSQSRKWDHHIILLRRTAI
jgi:hypothetical protein